MMTAITALATPGANHPFRTRLCTDGTQQPDGQEPNAPGGGTDSADGAGTSEANPSQQTDAATGGRATLAATGDHTLWATLITALGGGIAIAGGALATRFKRKS